LPAEFPRTLIHHEPDNTYCPCGCALKRIGEDVSEKLDYTPGVFTLNAMSVASGYTLTAKR
jgi:transposase